ncbi:MAG: glutamate synthase large subunit [Chloroflexi bacterium]|nr:glutamate synthase large subunit [Chloroflexota bacterium]MCL5275187.1 glutamate synthase large subunit [Chloroflexota bacterium]
MEDTQYRSQFPQAEGLYDPKFEHDACGVGLISNIKGRQSHDIVRMGLEMLVNLSHRGAVGSDPETGDGAGILMQIPHQYLKEQCADVGIHLPQPGQYAVGMLYTPRDNPGRSMEIFEKSLRDEDFRVLGWRRVPTEPLAVGVTARSTVPEVMQVFVSNPGVDYLTFERQMFIARRVAENAALREGGIVADRFYIPSLGSHTIVYKGMMMAHQLGQFYPELNDEQVSSAVAIVHARYSTNTFPSWPLAQPFRAMCHNGEINTLRGNINKLLARRSMLATKAFGDDIKKLMPIIIEGMSDSACFDNMLEMLYLGGRSLPHSILMMIPEAWGDKYYMGHDRRGFYEYHANIMEPWDGPAAILFTDGIQSGGILDRNGLRPLRYTITKNDLLVLGSETGALEIETEDIIQRGRLRPGKMMIVDVAKQRVFNNDEVKADICRQQHYRRWVTANHIEFQGFGIGAGATDYDAETLLTRQIAFGYTREDLNILIRPMTSTATEPIGSMGNDTPLAVLSDQPQLVFSYFKQIFAQVTNPPIDPIRERLVMSLTTFLGGEGNILEEKPDHARRLKLRAPILTTADLERIRGSKLHEFRAVTLECLFDVNQGESGLELAMQELCKQAADYVDQGYAIIILSDRNVSPERAPIPSLLAVSGVAHHLINAGVRNRVGLIVESGEPREVNHFALLLSFGCDGICPYLAFETVASLHADGELPKTLTLQDAIENYIKAVSDGILKILSKMGISTLRSYNGAQIYECIGFNREFIDRYFTKTTSRIGGIGIEHVARETLMRHNQAYEVRRGADPALRSGGYYSYRMDGERHLWSPEAIFYLQQATRQASAPLYRKFADEINCQDNRWVTLRSLLDFKTDPAGAVPLDEVEPADEIVKRFATAAMSFGSLSREAHETMAIAMNRMGARSNSGEGGEDSARYVPLANGDSRSSAVKQVASARFGVTAEYLANAKEIQIKIAQGAKPGEGGHLPGHKVNVEIAQTRNSTPGVSLISPPPHHDIYSIEDLAQLIFDLKNANPTARISVKLVSEAGVGTIAAGVCKGHADMVLISGGDGGTGASPLSSIKHAGLPWELGISETHQTLVKNDLRGRIRLQVDGQMRTGRDVAMAAMLGAEEFGFGTSPLIVLGCVMQRKCHLNTCAMGVTTQNPLLRARFQGKPEFLIRYFHFVAEELREIMAALGVRTVNELVGRTDLLKVRPNITHWKAKELDFSVILHQVDAPANIARFRVQEQNHNIDNVLDRILLDDAMPVIECGNGKVEKSYNIRNSNRTTGAMVSFEIARRYGHKGLPEDSITFSFTGSAGQSFGAFAARGLSLHLEGDANDYVGKGLSGGKLVIRPPQRAHFDPAENVIVGNTVLYGATSGEVYFNGLAGERFAVRNSGAIAVVEGVGDHGCEYMTGGTVAVLGPIGVNFAAGMSGGIAYLYDPTQDVDVMVNHDMVDLDPLTDSEDVEQLKEMIEKHWMYTGSPRARFMLDDWDIVRRMFVKVFPMEYRRALGQMKKVERDVRRTEGEKVEQA